MMKITARECEKLGGRHSYQLPSKRITRREIEVLECLARLRYANKEIACDLDCSEQTIKNHITSLFDKTGAQSRMELFVIAMQKGLIALPPGALDNTMRNSIMAIVSIFEHEAERWRFILSNHTEDQSHTFRELYSGENDSPN
jgi:DNA-binding CsgD family transcriptional regulator